jgi:hypothetical protein
VEEQRHAVKLTFWSDPATVAVIQIAPLPAAELPHPTIVVDTTWDFAD